MKFLPYLVVVALVSMGAAGAPQHASSDKPLDRRPPVKELPRTHHRIVFQGKPLYYWGGHFYHQSGGMYVSITIPIGAIVPTLPGGFVTIGTGPERYYYYAGAYYRPASAGYVVVEKPAATPLVLPAEEATGKIIVYPAGGQSSEQTGRDRYECHLWATDETGFDPTTASSDPNLKDDYRRATSACLEARDYVVK
tara:strand:- start:37526 stop:38110 length:585 start_codon:yes stop_codon:yes gene_type:complete